MKNFRLPGNRRAAMLQQISVCQTKMPAAQKWQGRAAGGQGRWVVGAQHQMVGRGTTARSGSRRDQMLLRLRVGAPQQEHHRIVY